MVIRNVERAVRRLEAVGVGDAVALVEHEAAFPGQAIILGQERLELVALAAIRRVGGVAVLDQQDAPGRELADVETGHRLADALRRGRFGPGLAAVSREALHEALAGARQHPERAVFALDSHVLVPAGVGVGHAALALPGRALVGRAEHVRAAHGVELFERAAEGAEAAAAVERDREDPLAGREHRGLVEGEAVPDAAGRGPHWLLLVGVLADGLPRACATVELRHRLAEEEVQLAVRVGPEVAHERAARRGETGGVMRVDHEAGLGPGLAVVVAAVENEEIFWAVLARNPARVDTPAGRARDADGHAVVELVVVVLRQRVGVEPRRDQREVGDLFRNLDLERADLVLGHRREAGLGRGGLGEA